MDRQDQSALGNKSIVKDLLEQLRKVHFTLVATCLILIIAASAKPSEINKRRREQATSLNNLCLDLSSHGRDILSIALRRRIFWATEESFKSAALVLQRKYLPQVGIDLGSTDSDYISKYMGSIAGVGWQDRIPVKLSENDTLQIAELAKIFDGPVSLQEFATFWNSLSFTVTWPNVESLALENPGALMSSASSPQQSARIEFLSAEPDRGWLTPDSMLCFYGRLSSAPSSTPFEQFITMTFSAGEARSLTIRNEVCQIKQYGPTGPWSCSGRSFEQDFPLVVSIMREQPTLGVYDLLPYLDAQEKEAPIKLLGFEIPQPQFRFWGIIGIIVIQVYFFLHYRTWTTISSNAGVLEVAWIGSYRDIVSQVFFWLSLTMPAVTIVAIHGPAWVALMSGVAVSFFLLQPLPKWWRFGLWSVVFTISVLLVTIVRESVNDACCLNTILVLGFVGILTIRLIFIAAKQRKQNNS